MCKTPNIKRIEGSLSRPPGLTPGLILVLCLITHACAGEPEQRPEEASTPDSDVVGIQILKDRVRVTIDEELFTEYRYLGQPVPLFFPIHDRAGRHLTRRFPLEELAPGEVADHPHHRSLWFAHGSVNGIDFWHRGGKILHEAFLDEETSAAGFSTSNRWVSDEGTTIARDRRRFAFGADETGRYLDFEITLIASEGSLTLGDTKEGTMAIRMAPTLRLKGKVAEGRALNSEGAKGREVWGKRAAWVDYSAGSGAAAYGIAIFDHPRNPRHPTWWHARDYGLVAANPFGISDFEKKKAGSGDLVIPAGESRTWRYRFLFHEGETGFDKLALQYRSFSGE